MGNVNGEWIMVGCERNDPYRLKTPEDAIKYINEIGFLPLFLNKVPGFSLEERTVADYWWSGDVENDPWEWRRIIAESQKVAYGKFFDGKAGFISLEWLPYFANWRRDGYDFDALWDDGKAKYREKKIMDCFLSEDEYLSNALKRTAALGKDAEKYFDITVNRLQMQMYIVTKDFRQRKNKQGMPYGWHLSVLATPESIWGYDLVTSAYREEPEESRERIFNHIREEYPIATEEQIQSILRF